MIPPGTRRLLPLPRPVGLKNDSIDIIRADLPDVTGITQSHVNSCTDRTDVPLASSTIDDLIIYAIVAPIDGAGGSSGPPGPASSARPAGSR